MKEFSLLIDNEWVTTSKTFESINPSTESPIARLAIAGDAEVDLAVKAARQAFDDGRWSNLPGSERGRILRRAADILRRRAAEFAEAETLDTGKPIFESRNVDVPIAIDSLEYYGCLVVDLAGRSIPVGAAALDYTVREPIGVIAAIIPWNFPLVLACRKLGPALAAGNTVVLKPANVASLTTVMLGEVFKEAGLPPGVLNILTGPGSVTGHAMMKHRGVDKLSFTGSTQIGQQVINASAEKICTCTLELGGKSPAVVLEDADLDTAVEGILFGAFLNQGECCCAATRVLVDRKVHGPLVERLVKRTATIVVGDGMKEETRMGPLISADQRKSVMGYIRQATKEIGKPVIGGGTPAQLQQGYFVEATIFDNVPVDNRLYREEVFGPVLTVTAFDGESQLIAAANDTPYGLAASIWTRNSARGQRLASQVRAGTVWVNIHNFVFNSAPYGGCKQSGIGRELGREGLDAYTEIKNVITWTGETGFKWY